MNMMLSRRDFMKLSAGACLMPSASEILNSGFPGLS